jgi:hypothetical protein
MFAMNADLGYVKGVSQIKKEILRRRWIAKSVDDITI